MALDTRRFERKHTDVLRDLRPAYVRVADWAKKPANAATLFFIGALFLYQSPKALMFADLMFVLYFFFFIWLVSRDRTLPYKMPSGSKWKDKNNEGPGRNGQAEGILYLGNVKDTKEEVWFTNSDARTHILYLGTTGSGKTEGLKSLVTNAMTWGSGFVYVDGKADTDLWSSLSSLVRRFGRDDDLLVLNYMTGNSDTRAPSNTMNPFSSGSASYLTNMLVSLMPDAEGDNAMWKDRAVALVASLMPALTWRRDNLEIPLSIGTIRDYLNLPKIIQLARDQTLPEDLRVGVRGYLDTLPGYIDAAFDDNGQEKPPGPDQPAYDTTTPRQQHGYLSMQFTRALQSLGDEYGYIFDTQAADVDMVDVVLNRRMLVVLIPALEKSSDETANLGKIVAATIKGMMGSTLGSTVEGESATVIENKPTHSSTPFMTVFDEVGYYTAQGMAVMAAQARSLGFCLIYAAQDLPALEKRVKEEARSITANCNLKIFGKLEDPTQTKEFFEKTVGETLVMESSGFQLSGGRSMGAYQDNQQASLQVRRKSSYDGLKGMKEGEAVVCFGEAVYDVNIFYSNPGHAKAMRVTRYLALPPPDEAMIKHAATIARVRDLMVHKTWTAAKADVKVNTPQEIQALADMLPKARAAHIAPAECGMAAVAAVHALFHPVPLDEDDGQAAGGSAGGIAPGTSATPPLSASPMPSSPLAAPPATPAQQSLAQPSAQPPAQTPVQPPAQPQEQPQAQQPAAPPAAAQPTQPGAGAANPMSFFAKKPDGGTPPAAASQPPAIPPSAASPQTAPADSAAAATPHQTPHQTPTAPVTPPATGPINWEDLIRNTGSQPDGASPVQPADTATPGTMATDAPAAGTGTNTVSDNDPGAGIDTTIGQSTDAAIPTFPRTPLDDEARRLLDDAARDVRNHLMKDSDKDNNDDIEAAE